ncbi:MAG: ROK family protein [Actinomycetia bacterium]|nr:ROK family protein [Actinomycetes bacterium]MCP4962135.1 ROK family protein [Actinomycetes bacterium]
MLGIDIGGSGIKGAPVDLDRGEFAELRHRVETPQPATPKAVLRAVGEVVTYFDWEGPIGCTFPAVVQGGTVVTASNVDRSWIGTNAADVLSNKLGHPVLVVNDADAAGVAEMEFGAGRERQGTVLIVTLGTGIGTSLFVDGTLVPNTELGHIEIDGVDAETRAASRWRNAHGLTWKQWGGRVNKYLCRVERLVWPELIIIGGGVSRKHERFFPYLDTRTPIVAAQLRNDAGIIGAALLAARAS